MHPTPGTPISRSATIDVGLEETAAAPIIARPNPYDGSPKPSRVDIELGQTLSATLFS